MKQILPEYVLQDLNDRAKIAGSKVAFANECDVDSNKIHTWLLGKSAIPEHVLNAMGWEVKVTYTRINNET